MKNIFKNLYITTRFFLVFGGIVVAFAFGFVYPILFPITQTVLVVAIAVVQVDIILLFSRNNKIHCQRFTPKVLSLGSENSIRLEIENNFAQALSIIIIDELPYQLQTRDFSFKFKLKAKEKKVINYSLKPLIRGEYLYGKVNIFASTILGLTERRFPFPLEKTLSVYPSILLMKKLELKAFAKASHQHGIKKIRRIGHSTEFEQIKNYVSGDDYQSVNWKATSRRNTLMVNHYEDERAQHIYSIIDKSRIMKMPFDGLSLLDYAINTSLVISNVALQKMDRAGLITFAEKIDTTIKAESSKKQLRLILDALYNEREGNLEANYELLYTVTRNFIRGRSLLFLFTNFESIYGMERVLPVLRKLNKLHLLVVIFFENSEIIEYSKQSAKNVEDIYLKTIAQKFIVEKQQIIYSLRQYGIQAILTKPEELALNTVNKYLELKSRGMI